MTEYEELDAQLRRWLADDRSSAADAEYGFMYFDSDDEATIAYYKRQGPAHVMADIDGKVALLDHVAGWEHAVVDGNGYYSCGLAVDPDMPFPAPGTGCWDQQLAGIRCTCGLDGRRIAVLKCIVAGYAERPGFKPEWRLA